jgi:hypothetical protein
MGGLRHPRALQEHAPTRERELLILRTGWLCRSEYEWGQRRNRPGLRHHRRGDREGEGRPGRSGLGRDRR